MGYEWLRSIVDKRIVTAEELDIEGYLSDEEVLNYVQESITGLFDELELVKEEDSKYPQIIRNIHSVFESSPIRTLASWIVFLYVASDVIPLDAESEDISDIESRIGLGTLRGTIL